MWTGFAFAGLIVAIVAVAGLIGGLAQTSLDHPPHALWLVAVAGLAAVGLWLAARLGQRLGRTQMTTLRAAIAEAAARTKSEALVAATLVPAADASAPLR